VLRLTIGGLQISVHQPNAITIPRKGTSLDYRIEYAALSLPPFSALAATMAEILDRRPLADPTLERKQKNVVEDERKQLSKKDLRRNQWPIV
jgi:hypothetical protein